jgi:ferredoxin like protein
MMGDKKLNMDEKMATVHFNINKKEAHITVKKELCSRCEIKPCLSGCPAENYTWEEGKNELAFNYEGCLECGCCRFVCPLDAIEWSYPRGGFGVTYMWG